MTDRERAPCPRCGVKLYDKYFGNGGWMPTETKTGRHHHHDDCAEHLAAIAELEAALRGETARADEREARASAAQAALAEAKSGETMRGLTDQLADRNAQVFLLEAALAKMTKLFEGECDAHEHTGKQRDEYRAALAAEKEGRRKAEADNAELRRALKEDGETMQKAIVIHEKCHVERNEQRMRAVAAEQEAFGARSQLLKAEERADRLREYAVAIQNGGHYEALQPGDLDAPKKTP